MSFTKKIFFSLALALFFNFLPINLSLAVYDPSSVPNNSFGIHIANIQDLEDAARLVNSQGGDWGYVTLVITKGDRDVAKWQGVLNKMRVLHLIPIFRLATRFDGSNWEKPALGDIDGWVSFLNSLNWVIKNRYLVIGNEVNSAKEWGGEVNPEAYATYVKEFSAKLKKASLDFFIMAAGLDASIPSSRISLNEAAFIKRVLMDKPDLFENLDGWASHSYPNPNFSGSENGRGKGSVRTFEWELWYLKTLGVKKTLPVFITETGWSHRIKQSRQTWNLLKKSALFPKFETAFNNAWNNKQIAAVTPFILNYEQPPYDIYSWKNDGAYNSLYGQMQNFPKKAGEPIQDEKLAVTKIFVPAIGFVNSNFTGIIIFINTGQSIIASANLNLLDGNGQALEIQRASFTTLEPGASGFIFFHDQTPDKKGLYSKTVILTKNKTVLSSEIEYKRLAIAKNLTFGSFLWHPD